jgi:hypothetical protein
MLVGGLSIAFNKCAKWPAMRVGLTLLSFALLIHLPGLAENRPTNLLKDLALSGAAFYFAGSACMSQCKVDTKKDGGCC